MVNCSTCSVKFLVMWSNFDTHDRKIGSCGEKLLHTILLLHRQCLRVYDNYHVCCGVAYAWSKDGTRGHYQSRYQRGLVTHTHSNNSIELPGKAHSVLPLQWMEPLCALYALCAICIAFQKYIRGSLLLGLHFNFLTVKACQQT